MTDRPGAAAICRWRRAVRTCRRGRLLSGRPAAAASFPWSSNVKAVPFFRAVFTGPPAPGCSGPAGPQSRGQDVNSGIPGSTGVICRLRSRPHDDNIQSSIPKNPAAGQFTPGHDQAGPPDRQGAGRPEGPRHRRQLRHRPGGCDRARPGGRRCRRELRRRRGSRPKRSSTRSAARRKAFAHQGRCLARKPRCARCSSARSSSSGQSTSSSTTPGCSATPPFQDMTLEQWNTVIGVNLTGQFLCAREAIREFSAAASCRRFRGPPARSSASARCTKSYPGRPRQLCGIQGRRHADDEDPRPGGGAACASASTASLVLRRRGGHVLGPPAPASTSGCIAGTRRRARSSSCSRWASGFGSSGARASRSKT